MRQIKRAVVLGAGGFIGRHLVRHLCDAGIHTTGVVRGPTDVDGVNVVVCDVLEDDLATLLQRAEPDAVFHLVGSGTVPRSLELPAEDLRTTTASVIATLEAARRITPAPVIVLASSAAVYGTALNVPMGEDHPLRPVSPYGVAKLAAENYARVYAELYGVPTVIGRAFSVYGPGQKKLAVFDLMRRLAADGNAAVDAPAEVTRDFVYVSDVVAALAMLAANAPAVGEAYNIASGRETSLGELVRALADLIGTRGAITFTGQLRSGDPLRWVGDPSAAVALGATFDTSLDAGLANTVDWFKRSNADRN